MTNRPGKRLDFYVKPKDLEILEWAKTQRESLSELIALGLIALRKQREGKKNNPKASR